MILSTTPTLDGYRVAGYLGIVSGEAVMRITVAEAFAAVSQALAGERRFGHFEEAMRTARQEATALMVKHAREIGAQGVLGIRIDSEVLEGGCFAMTVYGTAVTFAGAPPAE